MTSQKRIGLTMIVKNESRVIERCLKSVVTLIDYVMVCDTGSTDATREIVREFLDAHGIPGKVIDEPWQNFAHNRSVALATLRDVADIDYGFTIDADETLVIDESFDAASIKAGLTADLYELEVWSGSSRYGRPALFSNRKPFVYRAVLHEYLEAPAGATRGGQVDGLHVLVSHDGARSANPNKFADDARLLEAELARETDPFLRSRYTFYLAQSLRDSGQLGPARAAYLQRAEMGYWQEEVYVALLRAAQLAENLRLPTDEIIAGFLRAYELIPTRGEALHGAAAVCRQTKRYQLGYLLARAGLSIERPASGLFLDQTVYDYRMLDEFQINAYWAGHFQESLDAGATLLRDSRFPESDRARITANTEFALKKVVEAAGPDQ